MCPILHLPGGVAVPAYGLFTALAAVAGVALALPLLRRAGLPARRGAALLATMAGAFLCGARLWNFLVDPQGYTAGLSVFSLRLMGFSLYGGLAGAFLAFLALARAWGYSPWPLLDALVLPQAAALALVRVGCFLNGCCGGIPTGSWLGVRFPEAPGTAIVPLSAVPLLGSASLAVYPTQLMEPALLLPGLALALMLRRRSADGVPFLIYGVWFTAARWILLPLRVLPYPSVVVHVLYPLLYGLLIALGWGLLAVRVRSSRRAARCRCSVNPANLTHNLVQ